MATDGTTHVWPEGGLAAFYFTEFEEGSRDYKRLEGQRNRGPNFQKMVGAIDGSVRSRNDTFTENEIRSFLGPPDSIEPLIAGKRLVYFYTRSKPRDVYADIVIKDGKVTIIGYNTSDMVNKVYKVNL